MLLRLEEKGRDCPGLTWLRTILKDALGLLGMPSVWLARVMVSRLGYIPSARLIADESGLVLSASTGSLT